MRTGTRLVISYAFLAVVIWTTLPEHRRHRHLMRAVQMMRQTTQKAARSSGRYGIHCELAGDPRTAQAGYTTAYDLMTGPYQRITAWYDKLRQT